MSAVLRPTDWHYFAEGAANLILRSNLPKYQNQLLRVRKLTPGSPSVAEINHFYQTQVIPVLGDYYVHNELVTLPIGFAAALNRRPPAQGQRNDKPLDESERHAFLMESVFDSSEYRQEQFKINSTSFTVCRSPPTESKVDDSIQEIVLEFKPKWLLLSPNSGEKSIRCRTCALAYKRGKKPGFCPLDLVSDSPAVIEQAFNSEFSKLSCYIDTTVYPVAEIVARGLYKSELLEKLKQLQKLDGRGILWYDFVKEEIDEDFLTAMAARDCTLFITIKFNVCNRARSTSSTPEKAVRVGETVYPIIFKIADIDLKNPSEEKRKYWADIENSLIQEGWYFNKNLPACTSLVGVNV